MNLAAEAGVLALGLDPVGGDSVSSKLLTSFLIPLRGH